MKIERFDHIVLTVSDIDRTLEFYSRVLGMEVVTFAGSRKALRFGDQKINLHEVGHEFDPKATSPSSGSADLCLVTSTPIAHIVRELGEAGIGIVDGPGPRSGALGTMRSVYFRDPDGNLVEVSNYSEGPIEHGETDKEKAMTLAPENRDAEPARLTVRFDDFEFENMPLGLKRAGNPIEVRPQSLRLLELLIRNAGRIVSTEEIQRWLWPSTRHGDHARIIRVSMTHLRRALGDRQKPPKYIETIRAVGYRFVAPLEYSESQLVRRAESTGWAG